MTRGPDGAVLRCEFRFEEPHPEGGVLTLAGSLPPEAASGRGCAVQ